MNNLVYWLGVHITQGTQKKKKNTTPLWRKGVCMACLFCWVCFKHVNQYIRAKCCWRRQSARVLMARSFDVSCIVICRCGIFTQCSHLLGQETWLLSNGNRWGKRQRWANYLILKSSELFWGNKLQELLVRVPVGWCSSGSSALPLCSALCLPLLLNVEFSVLWRKDTGGWWGRAEEHRNTICKEEIRFSTYASCISRGRWSW